MLGKPLPHKYNTPSDTAALNVDPQLIADIKEEDEEVDEDDSEAADKDDEDDDGAASKPFFLAGKLKGMAEALCVGSTVCCKEGHMRSKSRLSWPNAFEPHDSNALRQFASFLGKLPIPPAPPPPSKEEPSGPP